MNRKTCLLCLPLLSLALAGCGIDETSSSSPEDTGSDLSQSSDSSSSTESSESESYSEIDAEAALSPLKEEKIAFRGTFNMSLANSFTGEPLGDVPSTIESSLTPSSYYFAEYDETGYYAYEEVYVDGEGYAVAHTLLPDNVVYDSRLTLEGEPIVFAEYYANPFLLLAHQVLTQEEDHLTLNLASLNTSLTESILYALTGYYDLPYGTIDFRVSDGLIDGGLYTGFSPLSEVTIDGATVYADITITFDFELVDVSELESYDPVAPLPTLEGHEALQGYFDAMKGHNFTLEVKRIGGSAGEGAVAEFVDYYTESAILHTYKENGTGSGFYADEDLGLVAAVSLDAEGKMNAIGQYEAEGTKITDFMSSMAFAPEVFDINEDGSYTLKTGYNFERYIQSTSPDQCYNYLGFLAYLTPGTYTITLNDDGTVFFTYDYAYVDYVGVTVSGTIEVTVKDIGTTELDYVYVPYEAPEDGTWEVAGENALAILEKYLGPDYASLLPYVDLNQCYSNSWRDSVGGYGQATLIYNNPDVLNQAKDGLIASMLELGWTEGEYDEANGRQHYNITVDGITYDIALQVAASAGVDRYFYIFLYPYAEAPSPLSLNEFIAQFAESENSRGTYTKQVSYYHLQDGGKGELYTQNDLETDVVSYQDNAFYKLDHNSQGTYLVEDADGAIAVYNANSLGDVTKAAEYPAGTFASLTEYVSTYGLSFLPPSLLTPFAAALTEGEGGSVSVAPGYEGTIMTSLAYTVWGDNIASYENGSLEVSYDAEAGSLSVSFLSGRVSGNYYVETSYSVVIDMAGQVEIDLTPIESVA